MLRIIQNSSPGGAKSYYSTADYYTEGQELKGVWQGTGAARLGLSGEIAKADWDALCDNLDPSTGRSLTARQREGRRVGYDFNFHVPKSVSVLYGLTQDERILRAFQEAVRDTMRDVESEMQTRVRRGGRDEDRTTGNMVWGEYIHTTARPVDGVPDPHLHAHCFVFNATWDAAESRWKAGQFASLKRDGPYFEALFHSRFARGLQELGVPVARTRGAWELAGIPTSVVRAFARRTALIEAEAERLGIHDPDRKGELGAATREGKSKQLSTAQLRTLWRNRLTPDEARALGAVSGRVGAAPIPEDPTLAKEAIARSLDHMFERKSVVGERRLLADALKRAAGVAAPSMVQSLVAGEHLLSGVRDGHRLVSTRAVLAEEQAMLRFAREGRGGFSPLGPEPSIALLDGLKDEQRHATLGLLASRDRVSVLRGVAGTGKTTMMRAAVRGIEAGGARVLAFAPSAEASRGVLRTEGFADAETVAHLLVDTKLQDSARDQVIWVDEAGLLGARTMNQLFRLAERVDARIVLSGDYRQHGSVERGSPLLQLEQEAGIVPVTLRQIQRQDGKYREAVRDLSEGRAAEAFKALDGLGWIREVQGAERYAAIADEYADATRGKKTALSVAPTHLEGAYVTAAVRSKLQALGRLSKDEREVPMLVNANLTEGERADATSYEPGDVLVFHQNARGYQRGDRVVAGKQALPLDRAARFQVFKQALLRVAKGDVLRITRGGKTLDGKHALNNGMRVTVRGFDRKGNLVLANGWKIARDFGHLTHGYVGTSHASQGKTFDRVIIAQGYDSLPASSAEQFYVSVSRGRERATIYTEDKAALLEAVSRHEDRLTAIELERMAERSRSIRTHAARIRQASGARPRAWEHGARMHE